jgi:FAD/FMN-containing dehydrogenase
MSIDALIRKLEPVLGADGVLRGEQVAERSAGIWRKDKISAPVIFRPSNTQQVATILQACYAAGQSVITHGGLTGLAGGAIASATDVVLSTERLNKIENLNAIDRTLRVQAGVTLQAAQEKAAEHGLMVALDLGARGSCTLGGNAATNAGGHQVIRYGMARESILGLEVVLADGTVLNSLNAMLKNNAGYDLKHLFIGSEGTLGIITRLDLRLRPASLTQETALLACTDFSQVTRLLNRFDAMLGGTLSAFEVMWNNFYRLVADPDNPLPNNYPYYILVEALGGDSANDNNRFVNAIAAADADNELAEVVIAKSGAERTALWSLRDRVERTLELGPAQVFDVSLPLSTMEAYVAEVLANLDTSLPGHQSFVFGHVGDGNLHIVCANANGSGVTLEMVETAVYEPLKKVGGSVSGEHGIGLEKKPWLAVSRNTEEIALMQQIKRTLDPQGILNPGRIFDIG